MRRVSDMLMLYSYVHIKYARPERVNVWLCETERSKKLTLRKNEESFQESKFIYTILYTMYIYITRKFDSLHFANAADVI